MAMKPGTMDGLRELIVAVLDAMRRDALKSGLSPLKQYDQIASRMQIAARTAATVGEWATEMLRRLQIASPSNSLSSEILALDAGVRLAAQDDPQNGADLVVSEMMDTVIREHGYFIARLRQEAAKRTQLAAEKRQIMEPPT